MKYIYNFFILIPRFDFSGPVKGAIALANGLILTGEKKVFIVSLFKSKLGNLISLNINKDVQIINLDLLTLNSFFLFLKSSNSNARNISISFCFMPDLFNIFIRKYSLTVSSLRGNLFMNYKFDYRFFGIFLAFIHFRILKMHTLVLVMTDSMKKQALTNGIVNLLLVPNFIHEIRFVPNKKFFNNSISQINTKYLYVGSYSDRKNVLELVECFVKFKKKYTNISLDMYGAGPLRRSLDKLILNLGADTYIFVHDHSKDIEKKYSFYDVLVLPSLSEGTPRVALEALFNGLRCILRNVDGASEFYDSENVFLFNDNDHLIECLSKAYLSSNKIKKNLLSVRFSQKRNSRIISKALKSLVN